MEFAYPLIRWLIKGWFFLSGLLFFYLFYVDIFVHRWFILMWAFFSLGLGVYVAPAIRIGAEGVGVKYLWRYRQIPWHRVVDVHRTLLGAQILTREANWAYRVVGYQFPMPRVRELVSVVRNAMERGRLANET